MHTSNKIKIIAVSILTLFIATTSNAQMFSDIKRPSTSIYEVTTPSEKNIKNKKDEIRELVTQKLQSEEVGAGAEEITFFRTEIRQIYNEMDEAVHLSWSKNKKNITSAYADIFTPEELIVYNKYISSPEFAEIEKKRPKINKQVDMIIQKWLEKTLDKKIQTITQKIIKYQLNVD